MKTVIRQIIAENSDINTPEPPITTFTHTSRLNELLSDIADELHRTGESKESLIQRIEDLYVPSLSNDVHSTPNVSP